MKIYGHRGAGGEAPENTIAACLHAMERGAKYLEVDLRLSADKQFVVIHDSTVNRSTHHKGRVIDYTAAELAKMDARRIGPPWPRKKNCGVVSLDALLNATAGAKGYFLEIKHTRGIVYEEEASLIAERFPTRDSVKGCVIISLDMKLLKEIRFIAPHIPLGFLSATNDIMRKLDDFMFEHLIMHWHGCSPLNIMKIRRKGIKVGAWTINDPLAIRALRGLKIDNLITDYPSMAIPLLASMERK